MRRLNHDRTLVNEWGSVDHRCFRQAHSLP
jgi:hypothetical protein